MSNTATILLVDDLEANLIAMAALLQAPGIRLLLARSGAEALRRWKLFWFTRSHSHW